MASKKSEKDVNFITDALLKLSSNIPDSDEDVSSHPEIRATLIARKAATKAAAVSGTLALPPGPAGLVTIVPDLIAIWRIQQAVVADIAAIYGKTASAHFRDNGILPF